MKKKIILEKPILQSLEVTASELRSQFDSYNIFTINVMASPGAGKTSVIMRTIEGLKDVYRIAVIEGDVVPIDVEKIKRFNIPVVLAQTSGACHLDSKMMEVAVKKLDVKNLDIIIVENVGNLICPAHFPLGTHKNIVIASVPEGDDKPLKYPHMFRGADLVLLNKSDYLSHEAFNLTEFKQSIRAINPKTSILLISAKTGENIDLWIDWIKRQRSINVGV